jgi:hypothetical protein
MLQALKASPGQGVGQWRTLVDLFLGTTVRQLSAAGTAASPDKSTALGALDSWAWLLDTFLTGEGGRETAHALAAGQLAGDKSAGVTLDDVVAVVARVHTLPSFSAQLHVLLAGFRLRRAFLKSKAHGVPALAPRVTSGMLVRSTCTCAQWGGTAGAAVAVGAACGGWRTHALLRQVDP